MTKQSTILQLVADHKLTPEQAAVMLESVPHTHLQISSKGCVSLYLPGRRWPISLYSGEWELVLERANDIRAFVGANRNKLDKIKARRA
jgi:hypothetical protein